MRVVLIVLGALIATTASAQPGATPPAGALPPAPAQPLPPPPSALAPALAGVVAPDGWSRVDDALVVWTNPDGRFVSAGDKPGTCLGRSGLADLERPPYFRLQVTDPDRFSLCLQLIGGASAIVTIGTRTRVQPWLDAGVEALVAEIAARLRPPVAIPTIGVTLRPRLAILATDDGFAIDGLPFPAQIALTPAIGSCGTLPATRGRQALSAPPVMMAARWSGSPSLTDERFVYCLERRDDAIEVALVAPALARLAPAAFDPALLEVLTTLHDAVAASSAPPLLFGPGSGTLELPHAHVVLHDTVDLGHGFRLQSTPKTMFKLVDGAGWNEPDTDLLLPTQPARFAVGLRRQACAIDVAAPSPLTGGLFPRELGRVGVSGRGETWRAWACANGFAIVVHALRDDPRGGSRDALALTTAMARSVGVGVQGTPFRPETLAMLTVPIVWSKDNGTHWALAVRGRGRVVWGRPLGVVGMLEIAFGAGSDDFHPGDEMIEEGSRGDHLGLDGLIELRGAAGLAASAGPFTLDVTAGAVAEALWPDGGGLEVAAGAGLHVGANRLQVRYTYTLLHPAHAAELVLATPRYSLLVKTLDFDTDTDDYVSAGRPTRGLEIGLGLQY